MDEQAFLFSEHLKLYNLTKARFKTVKGIFNSIYSVGMAQLNTVN